MDNFDLNTVLKRLLSRDPYLTPYEEIIHRRLLKRIETELRLTQAKRSLVDFAAGHEYFGLHFRENEWIFREWAPNATRIFLIGNMTGWQEKSEFELQPITKDGNWEIRLPQDKLKHGDPYRLRIHWPGGEGDRIPSYTRRVIQDPETLIFNAQVWSPDPPHQWRNFNFQRSTEPPLIYEVHVGMAQVEEKIGSYCEFTDKVLPRVISCGYNTLQLMAIQEHPYYGSFGYQVSSFFAASSRFGSPEELKELIDEAHSAGLAVIMDLVHSHAVSNEVEGLSCFDGTLYQFFHKGSRGRHPAWDSRCFDYAKLQVMHFLLSNCRFWMDEYRLDGFRFDGVTSMLYLDHGLEKAFTSYDDYFGDNVDEDALTYLALANKLIHSVRPDALTVAEDVSGMPGLAVSIEDGGYGFDYRLAMGIPDFWIKIIKEVSDENWSMSQLWNELMNRRVDEKTISYVESHDQALVGDKTIIFRLLDAVMYDAMQIGDDNVIVDRGMALHKMIRLITLATAGSGYLNFMGNEFGHPEWIDFPREENNWSYKYARRQWHLADDDNLKFKFLARFDKDMIFLARNHRMLESAKINLLYEHSDNKLIIFERAGLLFAFNFHPQHSYSDYRFEAPQGKYQLILDSDAPEYGGHARLTPNQAHDALSDIIAKQKKYFLSLYLPNRTGIVLRRLV